MTNVGGIVVLITLLKTMWACQIHLWRGNEIWCCPNGTAYGPAANRVWVQQRPLLCGSVSVLEQEAMSAWQVVVAIGTLAGTTLFTVLGIKKCLRIRRGAANREE